MVEIKKDERYSMKDVTRITHKKSWNINYYIKTNFIKPNEYRQSSPNPGHKKIILGEAVLRILKFYS